MWRRGLQAPRKAQKERGKHHMKIDLWYEGETIAFANCTFYPNEGIYRGNLFNAQGRIIGDFSARDSVEIGKRFPGIFSE